MYTFDFSGAPDKGPRGAVWSLPLLNTGESGAGESFQVQQSLPLAYQLVNVPAVPTVSVARKDGIASDLTLTATFVTGALVQVNVAGGTDGILYDFTVAIVSNLGNTLVMQGELLVRSTLP